MKVKKTHFLLWASIVFLLTTYYSFPVLAQENLEDKLVITGFVDEQLPIKKVKMPEKMKERELTKDFPETIGVYLNGSSKSTQIAVTWYCVGEDYQNSDDYYFQFNPRWDEEKYALDKDLTEIQSPYVAVFLTGVTLYSTTNNANTIFDFLVDEMKLNAAAACGILANIYKESAFNPQAGGDQGTSYGICQWHLGRKATLISWCAANGYDYTTLTGQLHYLQFELSQNNVNYLYNGKKTYEYMASEIKNTADGAYEAGYYWCYYYEIPANKATTSDTRGNLARNEYWPKYSEKIPASSIEKIIPKLTSISNTTTGIKVSWDKVELAEGYYIYRKTGSTNWKEIAQINDVSTLTYIDKDLTSGTTYSYTVKAYNDTGVSGYNSTGISLIYLTSPNITKVENTTAGVKLTWNNINGATGYYLYRKVNSGSWKKVMEITKGSTLNYTDANKNLISGTTYSYRMLAYNGTKLSSYSSEKSIKYLMSPNLSSTANTTTGIKVTWKSVDGGNGYYVYRKSGSSGWTQIKTANSSAVNYIDTTAKKGTSYTYTVRAYNGSTLSSYYSGLSAKCIPSTRVSKLENTTSGVKITWGKVSGVTGYYVYRKTDSTSLKQIKKITGASTVTYTDTTAISGTHYTYTVRTYNATTMSGYHYGEEITYLSTPKLSSTTKSSTAITVKWIAVKGASKYYVYRKTTGGWSKIAVVSGNSTVSYKDTSVKKGVTYKYTVCAYLGGTLSNYNSTGISRKFS